MVWRRGVSRVKWADDGQSPLFSGAGRGVPAAHLDVALNGRFDLFSHHVYAGKPESLDSTMWLAVLAAPRGPGPVTLKLLAGSTALSQAVDPGQAGAVGGQ